MAGRVPEHVIREIVNRADIVRIIGRYTNLQKQGSGFTGLCPFHKEKTPSFHVDPDEGLYHCFGCKAGGNIFTFLEQLEGLEFYEALQQLSQEAGVDISEYKDDDISPEQRLIQERKVITLRRVNDLAAGFYQKCLHKARGSELPRNYLKQRGINDVSIAKWQLGFAPDGWDNFLKIVENRQLDLNIVEQSGLIITRKDGGSYYDRFRNRVIFPVADRNGRVIGFGARALDEEQDAKYLNSPETPVFDKGSCFYGLDVSRAAIKKSEIAVIVEGYTDVIMAHQHGIENVIAVLGTALTEKHAQILSRLCEKTILLFDPDEAGRKSTERSIKTLLGADIDPLVAVLPKGLDPCDFLTEYGADAFKERLAQSADYLRFSLESARGEFDFNKRSERTKVFRQLAEMAASVPNEIKREMLIREIAGELSIEPQSAFDYMARLMSNRRLHGAAIGDTSEDENESLGADERFLKELLPFLIVNPDFQKLAVEEGIFDFTLFSESPERKMIEMLIQRAQEGKPVSESDFLYYLQDDNYIRNVRTAVEMEKKYAGGDKLRRFNEYKKYMNKKKLELGENEAEYDEDQWLRASVERKLNEENC